MDFKSAHPFVELNFLYRLKLSLLTDFVNAQH
jgi:hypothetical protein